MDLRTLFTAAVFHTTPPTPAESPDAVLPHFAKTIQSLSTPSPTIGETTPPPDLTTLTTPFLTPFPSIELKYTTTLPSEMHARGWWSLANAPDLRDDAAVGEILGGNEPPAGVSGEEWGRLWRAQLILLVLLECLRVHKLNPNTVTLPDLHHFPTRDPTAASDPDSDPESISLASRYSKRKRSTRSKKKKAKIEETPMTPTQRVKVYREALENVFDRCVIWDSLFFQGFGESFVGQEEEEGGEACGVQFRGFMVDCVADFHPDIPHIVESLFSKTGIRLPPRATTPILPATSPSRRPATSQKPKTPGRGVAASKRKRAPISSSLPPASSSSSHSSSILRRMSRASSLLQLTAPPLTNTPPLLLPPSQTHSEPGGITLRSRPRTNSIPTDPPSSASSSTGGFSAASIALATKGSRTLRSSLANLASRVVTATKPADAVSAGEKARRVLMRRMDSLQQEESGSSLLDKRSSTGAAGVNPKRGTREEKDRILKAREEKLVKASQLMTKRMGSGSGVLLGGPLQVAGGAVVGLVGARKGRGAGMMVGKSPGKDKLRRDLKLTERLRGPDVLLKRRNLLAEFRNANWDEIEQSCATTTQQQEDEFFVSDSPIKNSVHERPVVKLKVRSAKKRQAVRMLDMDSLFDD
ncbi:hypothetical protein HDU98_011689 [Podochytrium sp. JEL0797]|nr:hypothetical protein HDU98_011689 [Podochytrium sp. JEL0797]